MVIKNIVIINGKKVEIKDLDDKEKFADSININALLTKNYILEETA